MGAVAAEELMEWEKTQSARGEKILVSIRLRPLNAKEISRNEVSDWECINDNTILFRNSVPERSMLPTIYTYDRVFRSDCSTKQAYEEGAKEVAQSVVSGINSSIFAYGQTSSGKTFTMNGITEYTMADIYDYIQRHEERAFVLKFSAMEIYNEAVRDLLSADCAPLRLLDDPERGTIVEKLTEETLKDWNHLQELISICEAQRRIGETSLNETSSRSHQILRLTIESSAREFIGKDNSSTLTASVNFVDLAGSERASQALSVGTRLKEGCHINRSLLTLGTVIRKLSKGRNGHVPYRDSKLTRILQPSLGGNARTAIICTMSPARSHIEQSRNTLFFASCAKEVTTNAQVNVVMSDKALVKHLQRELARLESELRIPGSTSFTCDSAALLREKDTKIEKMEKEIKDLTKQRDLAQSRVEDLLRVVGTGHDQTSRLMVRFPIPQAKNTWKDQHSVSGECFDGHGGSNSEGHYVQSSEQHLQSEGTSPRFSVSSPEFLGPDPCQGWEEMSQGTSEDFDDLCKEVRCIEVEESSTNRNIVSDALSPEENKGICRELSRVQAGFTYGALEQKIQDMKRTIDCLVNPYTDESSPCSVPADISSSTCSKLTKSRGCRTTLMTSSSSPWFEKLEQSKSTPLNGLEKDFPGRPEGLPRKLSALNYGADTGKLSRKDSQISVGSASIGELTAQNIRLSTNEEISSIHTFVAGQKEMAGIQYEKQLSDDPYFFFHDFHSNLVTGVSSTMAGPVKVQETQPKADESGKNVKDVGLDPMQDSLEAPSNWPLVFERLQRDIFEFWHICNVPLVHRTYFFLLFRGDPTDSVYMEVELRRLSFLKDTFSQGNQAVEDGQTLTPASSMRALRREREMLSKQMQKRFSDEERESLYQKWGIQLDTKQRRLQLARRLWTDTKNMDHIIESASLVAKLVGFLGSGEQALKEMFGLSFTPWRSSRRSFSWRHSMLSRLYASGRHHIET